MSRIRNTRYPTKYPDPDPADRHLNQPRKSYSHTLPLVPCDYHRHPDSNETEDATSRPYDSDDSGWLASDDDDVDNVFSQRILLAPVPSLRDTAILINRRGVAYGTSFANQSAELPSSARQDSNSDRQRATNEIGMDIVKGSNGQTATSVEGAPGLGFVVAIVYFIRGDEDRARRAFAECAFYTIILSGAVAGEFFGGPLGAGPGGMAATPLAMLVKNFIAKDIRDPDIRAQVVVELSIKAVLKEMLLSGAFSALISFFGRWCGEWLLKRWGLEGLLQRLCQLMVRRLTKSIIESILEAMLGADEEP